MSRMNQWFVVGDGIAREVITADIQRYLGPDALVRPGTGTGEYEGRPGYWITAYRTLTSQMIQDLKLDSQRWQQEKDRDQRGYGGGGSSFARDTKVSRHPNADLVAYQDSKTHASRQHYGPSEGMATATKQPTYAASYGAGSEPQHYTHAPQASYSSHQTYGQTQPGHQAAPRTVDPYANYGQPQGRDYPSGYPAAQAYPYGQQPTQQDSYGRQAGAAQPSYSQPPTQSVGGAAPGYYIASDGRQYPLSQQPQPPQAGRRRG